MTNGITSTTIPVRRPDGASCVSGLVLARAFAGDNERTIEEARPDPFGRVFASSVEPMCRPDHKAKKHGRPKPKKWARRADRRAAMLELVGDGE
ncbi:MAG TPA: hypothetical protein VNS12_13355 [Pelagibacterium sp.]|uniref:hypothetical protein n=1 Tax=Pelagibacterium sp. TaxID=1967288 RepID=UPI002B91FD68|nr:hypothetical protein [Pelagibacterium sp.]HWJ89049.1 hypothetical protein [Pelagibacterium sp.]